ncbi:MAG: oligosaccharide repeat unit polymerase [Solobacterium sp.]|nr:oligosaccharide repeat unit polymerase [Solobacterium sp.]
MIYLLNAFLILMFFVSFYLNDKDILSPAFLFSTAFLFSSMWAVLYAGRWELGLHMNTFFVIAFGVFEFTAVCALVRYLMRKRYSSDPMHNFMRQEEREIPVILQVLFLLFTMFIAFYTARILTRWAGVRLLHFIEAGKRYDRLKFDSHVTFRLPGWLSTARLIPDAGCYWFMYSMMDDIVLKRKVRPLKVLIVFVCMFNSLLIGSRTNVINLVMAMIFFGLNAYQKKRGSVNVLTPKTLALILLIVGFILGTFQLSAVLLQRSTSKSFMDYLAMYLGAEIKNLDLFLQGKRPVSEIWGSQTFRPLVQSFGKRLGLKDTTYTLTLPYRSVNGFNLGNVYTVFYPFIYDFGYTGFVLCTALMAFLSQMIYEISRRTDGIIGKVFTLLYGGAFGAIVFSFFSNKFFENIITIGFAKRVVIWIGFEILFNHMIREKRQKEMLQVLTLQ